MEKRLETKVNYTKIFSEEYVSSETWQCSKFSNQDKQLYKLNIYS